jgi:hypothetical protein
MISHFRIWRDGATNGGSIAMNRGNGSKSSSLSALTIGSGVDTHQHIIGLIQSQDESAGNLLQA